jgi:uncharacterized flavoprotein (TIGR03862 family)
MNFVRSIAILGSGPAALMAADVLSQSGHRVEVFDKKRGPGRKLLIAGSSGLNITNSLPLDQFRAHYTGPSEFWERILQQFSPDAWLGWIHDLGLLTFKGTSGRYFVKEMKASRLLRAWLNRLTQRGVVFRFEHELADFTRHGADSGCSQKIDLHFKNQSFFSFDAVCFCLGGASYEPSETPLRWPAIFERKGLEFFPFRPSNVGYRVPWSEGFLKEAEGLPLKNIKLTSRKGSRAGDLVVTKYGLEGTPVYFMGESGTVYLDLKPDLSADQMLKKCLMIRENLSPLRRVKKQLSLCPASLALIFHGTPQNVVKDTARLVAWIKAVPVQFEGSQSIQEAISSSGGLSFSEVDSHLMLKHYPGVFVAGEMLNWDAPTGGFLIQGCVSQGYAAGKSILSYLASPSLGESIR